MGCRLPDSFASSGGFCYRFLVCKPRITATSRHGSTRYLWTEEQVAEKVRYVVLGQGEPMEVFQAPEWTPPSEPRA